MSTTQQRMALGFALVLVSVLAVGGWFWWQEHNQPPLPPVQAVPKTPSKPKVDASKAEKVPTREELSAKEMAEMVVPSAGNVSEYSKLQADLKVGELKLKREDQLFKLDEIRAKRAQLNAPPATPAPLPPLTKMPDLPMGNLAPPPAASRSARQSVAVVSVQGLNERISATIRTSNGSLVTVQVGKPFGGGKVTHISRQGVTLRSGSKNIVLPFE